jgi:hypothetical protein
MDKPRAVKAVCYIYGRNIELMRTLQIRNQLNWSAFLTFMAEYAMTSTMTLFSLAAIDRKLRFEIFNLPKPTPFPSHLSV